MIKPRYLFIILAIAILSVLFALSRREGISARDSGKLPLGFDICLAAGSGYQQLENDSLARLVYLRQYWADSSRQFFSKTLASPQGDTLFVSVFNNATLKTTQELLRAAGFEPQLKEQNRTGAVPTVKILARSADGTFFLRYLIDAGPFRAVTMADMPGADSSLLLQKFETGTFIQKIEPCL